jgi:hypothetical protein
MGVLAAIRQSSNVSAIGLKTMHAFSPNRSLREERARPTWSPYAPIMPMGVAVLLAVHADMVMMATSGLDAIQSASRDFCDFLAQVA